MTIDQDGFYHRERAGAGSGRSWRSTSPAARRLSPHTSRRHPDLERSVANRDRDKRKHFPPYLCYNFDSLNFYNFYIHDRQTLFEF